MGQLIDLGTTAHIQSDVFLLLFAVKTDVFYNYVGKVSIRTGRGGKDDSLFMELRHEFLIVCLEGTGGWEEDAELVVEPNFRDHFLIQSPTMRYKQVCQDCSP